MLRAYCSKIYTVVGAVSTFSPPLLLYFPSQLCTQCPLADFCGSSHAPLFRWEHQEMTPASRSLLPTDSAPLLPQPHTLVQKSRKYVPPKWFHNFFHADFSILKWLPFPVITFKRHKYDPSISRIFQSNFWRVFDVWPNCALRAAPRLLELRINELND